MTRLKENHRAGSVLDVRCQIPLLCEICGKPVPRGRQTSAWIDVGEKVICCPACKRDIYRKRCDRAREKMKLKTARSSGGLFETIGMN